MHRVKKVSDRVEDRKDIDVGHREVQHNGGPFEAYAADEAAYVVVLYTRDKKSPRDVRGGSHFGLQRPALACQTAQALPK